MRVCQSQLEVKIQYRTLGKTDISASALALGTWTVAQEGITYVLCGARKEAHVSKNVGAGELEIEIADLNRIHQDVEGQGAPEA